MLVEFRVKNFRSLRDEQVLSLVASKDKTLQDTHTLATGLKAAPTLLRSAVVYGANASGKSNLIKALQYMRGVVMESATVIQPGQTYAVQPFRLDAESASQPTEFEVTFILDGVRYQYGFAMTAAAHRAVSTCWFTRPSSHSAGSNAIFDTKTGKDVYDFGPGLKGPKNLWEGATRPNALFLSMAVQLNSEALRPVFDWFANRPGDLQRASPAQSAGVDPDAQAGRRPQGDLRLPLLLPTSASPTLRWKHARSWAGRSF